MRHAVDKILCKILRVRSFDRMVKTPLLLVEGTCRLTRKHRDGNDKI